MTFATFFLSSGRCGTQWLAKNLKASYGDMAVIEHEPILRKYMSKQLLGTNDPATTKHAQVIFDHVAAIEHHLETTSYIECGWPCYGALRYLARRLAGRMRVVHLTRDPIRTAVSMLPHSYYAGITALEHWALLTPTDAGVALSEFATRWRIMTRFEKCVYFWAEINALGLVLERELGLPWLRVKSEGLFEGEDLTKLLDFLDLPHRPEVFAARRESYDRWAHFRTEEAVDVAAIRRHPKIMAVAAELGYAPMSDDLDDIRNRFEQLKKRTNPVR